MDLPGLILMIIGAAVTYGSKYLVKILRIEESDNKTILIKTAGLLFVVAGMLRIFQII